MGFIPDAGTAQTWAAVWVSGKPSTEGGFWQRVRTGGGVMLDGVDAWAIDARRCKACGRLELFAERRPEAGTTLVKP